MMSNKPNPFDQLLSPVSWPALEQLDQPPHKVLARFIHGASEDPSCRTVAVTTLVMSLWELAGRRMSPRLPSLVLVDRKSVV